MSASDTSFSPRSPAAISLDHFFEASLELMCITDFEGRFQRLNPLWEEVLGWPSDELLGRPFIDFVHPDDRDASSELAAALISGTPIIRFENRVRTRHGLYRWFVWSANADADEKLIYATARDITQEKELEQKFLRSQRMEAIGALAAGIAHDLNNILSPIMMAANLLESEALSHEDMEELQSTIQTNVERGAGIVRQLLDFTLGSKDDVTIVDPRHLANDVIKLARETFPKTIDLQLALPKDLWRIEANPTKVHQVLMNLAVNARDAMPYGGTLTISADNISVKDNTVTGLTISNERAVRLTISDTGEGIPEELQAKVFDLFFTTKEPGRGTGLGLATVKGIIESLGGTITFTSDPNVGTTFNCVLPAVMEEQPVAVEPVHALAKGAGETIMIVDDESAVRQVLKKTLHFHGYNVLAACDGREALDKFKSAKAKIRLVITDVEMPIMDGLSMLLMMRRHNPELKAIICTGGQFQSNSFHLNTFKDRFQDCQLLQKPFPVRQMLQLVKDQLAAEPAIAAA